MFGWLILVGAIALALFASTWWWAAAIVLGIWRANQWYFYKGQPWRRIHFPLMRAYAGSAAQETVLAEREGRPFDPVRALTALVRSVHNDWGDQEARSYVERQIQRSQQFEDEQLITDEFRRRNRALTAADLVKLQEAVRALLIPPDTATLVRLVIAGLVEERHGSPGRAEYLVEILNGRAT